MEVDIQVERAAEALDQRHCAALRRGALDARLIRQHAGRHAASRSLSSKPTSTSPELASARALRSKGLASTLQTRFIYRNVMRRSAQIAIS